MSRSSRVDVRTAALRIAFTYLVAAAAWIVLSDGVLVLLGLGDAPFLQTYKGLLFVAVTAGVLYASVIGWLSRAFADRAIAESAERRLTSVSEAVPVAVLLVDPGGVIEYANPAALEIAGGSADVVVGGMIDDVSAGWMDESGRPLDVRRVLIERVTEGHRLSDVRVDLVGARRHLMSMSASPLRTDGEDVEGVVVTLTDLGGHLDLERRASHLERAHRFLVQISELASSATSIEMLLTGVCDAAVEHGGFGAALIARVSSQDGAIRVTTTCGLPADQFADMDFTGDPESAVGAVMLRALECGCVSVRNGLYWAGGPDITGRLRQVRRLRSCAVLPIEREGVHVAVVVLFSEEHDFFDETEVAFLDRVRLDLSRALDLGAIE